MADQSPTRAAPSMGMLQRLFRSYAFFAQQAVRRSAEYMRDVGELTRAGSIEPRLWVGCLEEALSGLTDDFGETLAIATATDGPGAPRQGLLPVSSYVVGNEGTTQKLDLKIPRWAFDPPASSGVKLVTNGLWRGESRILVPGLHLNFKPEVVNREDPQARLYISDPPPRLSSGLTVSGLVLASPLDESGETTVPPRPVMIVQVRFA